MAFGINDEGFLLKSFEDIISEIEDRQLAELSATANQSSTSVLGVLNAIFTSQLSEIWEVIQATYAGLDLSTATGVALEYLAQLVGLSRLPASPSTATVTFTTDQALTIPAGTELSLSSNPDLRFATNAEASIGGAGTIDVLVTCTENGPNLAPATTINTLENPITGVTAVSNAADATAGSDVETDEDFRTRIEGSVARSGTGTETSIPADVLANVPGLSQVSVLTNRTGSTDANGLPAHSIEVIVKPDEAVGQDDLIAQAIYEAVCAGDGLSGTSSGTATDTVSGQTQTIPFTRATDIEIVVQADLETDATLFGTEGIDNVKAALIAYVDSLDINEEVTFSKLYAPIFGISGVTDIQNLQISYFGGTLGTSNLAIDVREIANLQDANITLTEV